MKRLESTINIFDYWCNSAIREYLTGFRKRKLEKKKSAKERYDKIVREEKCKRRAEVNKILACFLDTKDCNAEAPKA